MGAPTPSWLINDNDSTSLDGSLVGKRGAQSTRSAQYSINYIEPKIKYGNVLEARWNKYEWPMLLVYMIIFVLFVGASIMICVCCCEKDSEEEEKKDEMDNS